MSILGAVVCICVTAAAVTGSPVDMLAQNAPGGLGIYNGKDARQGNHPYQAALFVANKFVCAAVIISSGSVLTTANCVDGIRGDLEVRGGIFKLDDNGKEIQSTITKLEDRVIHPKFDLEYLDNDIAIINNLNFRRIEFQVEWATLPSYSDAGSDLTRETATVTGWGSLGDDSNLSNVLQIAEISLADTSACAPEYGTGIIGTKLCASTDLASTCTGDAGGPAVITVLKKIILLGLVSHGSQDGCTVGKPVVFTRVSSFLDFIQDNAQGITISD